MLWGSCKRQPPREDLAALSTETLEAKLAEVEIDLADARQADQRRRVDALRSERSAILAALGARARRWPRKVAKDLGLSEAQAEAIFRADAGTTLQHNRSRPKWGWGSGPPLTGQATIRNLLEKGLLMGAGNIEGFAQYKLTRKGLGAHLALKGQIR